jgi:hypothetical protein
MFYTLRYHELEQIAKIYEVDISALADRLELDEEIISFQPHEGGVKIKTKNNENLILRFKDRLKS